jgi:peptidoglycan/xylan/chitin deacetylase (PgdA/CDA1 family)
MFYHHDITGAELPSKTLCLTYDDGPGKDTRQLAKYLNAQSIRATFFVVGRHAERFPRTLEAIRAQGHLIGSHTYSHPGIVDLLAAGGNLIEELSKTDRLIRPFASGVIYFRPPYGSWRETNGDGGPFRSAAAALLNDSGRFNAYLGPIMWDVTGGDWGCWERDEPVNACAARYLNEIERVGKGIVLMHDSSEIPEIANRNQTLALTLRLVPELKRRGFSFVRLDAVVAGMLAT